MQLPSRIQYNEEGFTSENVKALCSSWFEVDFPWVFYPPHCPFPRLSGVVWASSTPHYCFKGDPQVRDLLKGCLLLHKERHMTPCPKKECPLV